MTDLVLVNPNNRTPAPFSSVEPPLWLGLIAGYHHSNQESVVVVDAEAEGLTIEQTVQRVQDAKPKETIIVVMGNNPSVSSTPKMPVAEELLKHLDARLTGIHPIAVGSRNTLARPFEGLPCVPWGLLPMDKYRAHNWHCLDNLDKRSPYAVLYTSLNCPFNCNYCNIHTLYGDRTMRYRSMRDIRADLVYFAYHGIRNVKIWDELFCLNEVRVNQLCDFLISWGFKFNIWAYARLDTITQTMLSKMKKAGINWLAYGFESVIDSKIKTSEQAIQMTKDAGINIIGNFMFGLPHETMDDMKASFDMAVKENFEYVNFYCALPYPGSDWYRTLIDPSSDWERFSQFSKNIWADPDVVKFKDEAFTAYFSRPEYLSMIRAKFGVKAEEHIKEMLKWKIRK